MTETTDTAPDASSDQPASGRRKSGLDAMLLPELKQLAGGLGIKVSGLRKGAIVDAIKAHQAPQRSERPEQRPNQRPGQAQERADRPEQGAGERRGRRSQDRPSEQPTQRPTERPTEQPAERPAEQPAASSPPAAEASAAGRDQAPEQGPEQGSRRRRQGGQGSGQGGQPGEEPREGDPSRQEGAGQRRRDRQNAQQDNGQRNNGQQDNGQRNNGQQDGDRRGQNTQDNRDNGSQDDDRRTRNSDRGNQGNQGNDRGNQGNDRGNQGNDRGNQGGNDRNDRSNDRANDRSNDRDDDEDGGSRRNRRRRGRDRQTTGPAPTTARSSSRNEPDLQILEDDVLTPCAGILDLMDNYAFVRTSGYLPGTDDVYVSMSMVRRYGLRRGDAVTGQVRQPREGERKEKFNPLVRLDSVNGADPETARSRTEFAKLTPLYPSERLRLETTSSNLIGRVIDLAAPIGKGQRGLVVSPAKAGKTTVLQSLAESITTNNPECHLMVVLVDERPEEVTDFERSVKGEVISSTFDRPAVDHTIVAELAIERAKRLVELGHDVVVLLDGLTRLGRAYNLASPASGRILSGGVDSAALHPPKRFFGAARNIENGGSLTIIATALVESGSKVDEVIFEELKGTGNMEVRLRSDFADQRSFPAIDAVRSGTRREELLMSQEELAIVWKLRRVLSGLDPQRAQELLLGRLRSSQNNLEFLVSVQKSTPESLAQGD
ncbi:transcription termination factor Rho [Nocardioides scoriae]|uniref:Transcription termination factor Rho n=1 Tax=Nocardioides scoriae TaxID=642780 RepID=A0A1H1XXU9_9ACTN|nr:transcription termination factor Rho [Nocardioides scoriae]SDT14022.1 transcription termination factor Rho [Nocardioides scoriae]